MGIGKWALGKNSRRESNSRNRGPGEHSEKGTPSSVTALGKKSVLLKGARNISRKPSFADRTKRGRLFKSKRDLRGDYSVGRGIKKSFRRWEGIPEKRERPPIFRKKTTPAGI